MILEKDAPQLTGQSRAQYGQAALIVLAGAVLLWGCLSASFSTYDDPHHVSRNSAIFESNPLHYFAGGGAETYFPVSKSSFWLDRVLFRDWLGLENWAPGVRLMSWLYHAVAALCVWRLLLNLGLSSSRAFFVALVFSVHPAVCETVGWASERKNALAGMFGFAAVWMWVRLERRPWRTFPVTVLYAAACLSKPSALGFLPILILLELFRGKLGEGATPARPRPWPLTVLELLPVTVLSAVVTYINIGSHAVTLVAPPGGSMFTAILTDVDILSRYLFNLLVPVGLSAVYFVDPIVSLLDLRLWLYAGLLASAVAVTLRLSAHPWRSAFAWLWFVGALGPNLNLVAIPHFMQDRFMYVSTPAVFLILADVAVGLAGRLPWRLRLLKGTAVAYVLALSILAFNRSYVFGATYLIFQDAVDKQPKAAFARWGLGQTLLLAAELCEQKQLPDMAAQYERQALEHWRAAIDACPDAPRFTIYSVMACRVGEGHNKVEQLALAERYWQLAAECKDGQCDARADAYGYLAELRRNQGRLDESWRLAEQGLRLMPNAGLQLVRAKVALTLCQRHRQRGEAVQAQSWLQQAGLALQQIPADWAGAEEASGLLKRLSGP